MGTAISETRENGLSQIRRNLEAIENLLNFRRVHVEDATNVLSQQFT